MGIEGVIRPPPEIRAVADKTASYVAKNGRAFEARILGSGKGKTPKFAFLQPTSPFHAYYEDRIRFYENGGEDKKEDEKEDKKEDEKKDGDDTKRDGNSPKPDDDSKPSAGGEKKEEANNKKKKTEKRQKSSAAIDPIAKALLTQRSKISQARSEFEKNVNEGKAAQPSATTTEGAYPRKQHYTPPAPPPLELVQIVAPSSLTLAQVETIQLVAQFTALDGKGGPFIGKLQHREWANPAFAFCQPRHGHFAYFSALVDAYRSIYDTWTSSSTTGGDDMVHQVANNVNKCLELTAYRVEYERDLEEQTRKQKEEDGEIADIAQIDWHDFVVVETIDFPRDEKVELAMLPPPPPPAKTTTATTSTTTPAAGAATAVGVAAGAGDDMEESDDEDGETIRVVPSYKPKVVSQDTNNMKDVIDPITGKSIPVKDMPEHMRIQLLDPKWAEERKKFQEKQKDSNLVSGDVVASNISRFSRDAYGKSGHDLLSGETDAKKRLEEANRIIREQGQRGVGPSLPPPVQPAAAAGVALPPPPPPPPPTQPPMHPIVHDHQPSTAEEEPAAKRQRLEGESMVQPPTNAGGLVPPPPSAPVQPEAQKPPAAEAGTPTDAILGGAIPPVVDAPKNELLSAEEFVKTLSKPEVTLQVRIPNDPAQMAWNFYGQIVSVSVDVMSKIKAVKQEIARVHLNGMPANKIQLKSSIGFLKDSVTLASLNIGPTATLDMIPKTRGGRR